MISCSIPPPPVQCTTRGAARGQPDSHVRPRTQLDRLDGPTLAPGGRAWSRIISVILGGGRGQRLFPLTTKRAKPAVPFGGKFRLVDIPISNCLHAELRRIFLLTQFNSASLHRHIANTYRFDTFTQGLRGAARRGADPREPGLVPRHRGRGAPELPPPRARQPDPLHHPLGRPALPHGPMDMFQAGTSTRARTSRSPPIPVPREQATGLGILQVDASTGSRPSSRSPPSSPTSVAGVPREVAAHAGLELAAETYLASMGIYIFTAGGCERPWTTPWPTSARRSSPPPSRR